MRSHSRGASLLTTLSMVAVLAALGFALSQVCVQHLAITSVNSARQTSLDLARSAVSLGIAKISQDPNYGTAANLPTLTVPGANSQDRGLLVFDQAQARSQGVPFSLNNIQGTASLTGGLGQPVAKNTAQLVGIGYAGGQTHRIDVTLAIPPFPFAVASSGPVLATNGVEIAGIRAVPSNGIFTNVARLDADLASNDGSSRAVFLGANTNIQGSVQAMGVIQTDPNAPAGSVRVSGSVRSNASHEALPNQQLNRYDPIISNDPYTPIPTAALSGGAPLTGRVRRAGNLDVTGGLNLNGAVLYVDGDVNISGGLVGKGALVASGSVTINGQSQFQSGDGVAILCGRDTSITGSGPQGSFFQGLVYTQGKFSADHVTLLGNLISDDEANRPPLALNDARVFQLAGSPGITINLPGTTAPPPTTPGSRPVAGTSFSPSNVLVTGNIPGSSPSTSTITVNCVGPNSYTVQVAGGPVSNPMPDDQILSFITSQLQNNPNPLHLVDPTGTEQQIFTFTRGTTVATPTPGPTAPGSTGPVVITIDPSTFLRLQDRMRIVVWREDR